VIIDAVGQSHIQKDVQCAARDGRIVLLSFMSGSVIKEFNLLQVLLKRLRIEGSTLRSRDLDYLQSLRDRIVKEALPGIKEGKMKVFVEKVLDWNDVSLH
jgi:NADPH:quinone reductase-like Zn-dependent oxidoreductase